MYIRESNQKKQFHFVATDSEWDTSLPGQWISTCFAWDGGTKVFIRHDVPDEVRTRLAETGQEMAIPIEYVQRTDATDLLASAGMPMTYATRLAMFFSPKDVEYALGWEQVKKAIDDNKVRQRNNLSGEVAGNRIKDLYGWAGKGGLLKLSATLGIPPMENKKTMDEYKTCMWRGLLEKPAEYLRYAVDDARELLTIYQRFVDLFRQTQREILGMSVKTCGTRKQSR
jgi:hypothetical protein